MERASGEGRRLRQAGEEWSHHARTHIRDRRAEGNVAHRSVCRGRLCNSRTTASECTIACVCGRNRRW